MKIKLLSYPLFFLCPVFGLMSCHKVYEEIKDPGINIFDFRLTESQHQQINSSRGVQYLVTNPVPELNLSGSIYGIDRFEIRGESSLNFNRKGFSVNMDRKINIFNPYEQVERTYEKFKLLAMVFDYTYIENSISAGLLREIDLWPVYSFFTEVRLNNQTQGLYFFIENPVEYFISQRNSSFVLRRGYNHTVRASSPGPERKHEPMEYISRFNKIYASIGSYSGQQLYDTLISYMDIEQYFTKLSVDFLIKNGDSTDEVYFYTKTRNNKEVFGVFPWDYDDIFSDSPHEIGRSWATGTIFGHREYSGMDQVVADVGSKLLYSIEDDLDYKIARDSVLYNQYLKVMKIVIEKIDFQTIDKIFDNTFGQISPFYSDESIIAQSKFDVNETNYDLFVNNLAVKRQMLKERRNWILQELNGQQNQK
jgi:spore coat protein H